MKLMLSIMAACFVCITVLSAAHGFELPSVTTEKRTPYSFGHHYDYDSAGSSWNYERVYRDPGNRHHYSRWYYHYGHKPKPSTKSRSESYKKHSNFFFEKYGHYPGRGYSRHKAHIHSKHRYGHKGDIHRKFIQLDDRIPHHRFNHARPFNRVRIGR